jgi:hypothetical protein
MVSILPLSELKEKTLAMSAFFETSKNYPESYGISSGNHDGAGLSHGVLQYNFGTGSLKTLWSYMINTHQALCQSIFGANYAEWEDVVMNRTVSAQVAWGDSISYPKDGSANDRRFVLDPWNSLFMKLGTTQESIDKQVSMSDSWRVNADNWFNAITPIWSRKAYYLLWDISVQMGRFNPLAEVQAEFDDPANTAGMTYLEAEQWRCDRIAWHSAYNNAVSSVNQPSVFQRKDMIAKETGDWWGNTYNGVTFDAVLEPAFSGEITYAYPVITLLTDNNPRPKNAISAVSGFNSTDITIAFDQAITKYSVNRGGTTVETGVVLESGDVAYAAGQSFTVTINNADLVTGENTINIYGLNEEGLWSDGVTSVVTKPTYRYIRLDGFGEYNAGTPNATLRCVGLEVWSGGVDRLNGKVGTSEGGVDFASPAGYKTTGTNIVDWMTDHGATVPSATTNYAGYWDTLTANGNAFIVFDLGAEYPIDSIKFWNQSASGAQKAPRFKIRGTNVRTNFGTGGALIGTEGVDYETIWDYSANQTLFPLSPNHFATITF